MTQIHEAIDVYPAIVEALHTPTDAAGIWARIEPRLTQGALKALDGQGVQMVARRLGWLEAAGWVELEPRTGRWRRAQGEGARRVALWVEARGGVEAALCAATSPYRLHEAPLGALWGVLDDACGARHRAEHLLHLTLRALEARGRVLREGVSWAPAGPRPTQGDLFGGEVTR